MLVTLSPIDNSVYAERPLATPQQIDAALALAKRAQREWRSTPIAARAVLLSRFCDLFEAKRDEIALELTWQMGRPIRYSPNEVRGTLERARHMIAIAPTALADIDAGPKENFRRFLRREPLGVVFTIAAWNYPYLIAVNSIVPALMAGNTVILKHSAQTPLCAERFEQCLREAGVPEGVFQAVHMSHADTERTIGDARVDFVAFTGSVAGGHAVQRAASERFIGTGLELGGCDPVYVRHDADVAHAIENVVDGAYFNSGQSCCGLQRIYVHDHVYDTFVEGYIDLTRKYVVGNPLQQETTLGPVVRPAAADAIRKQIAASVSAGATPILEESEFPASAPGTAYIAPQVLLDVDHSMPVMREEIFGPVAGIMRVRSDEEAVALMNDTVFGLTAAIWTADTDAALSIADRIETGTFFMNRCDYLDPALAWVGVKDSGRGCTLSVVGYEHLTRPKSFHLRTRT
ncbi:acyl-CoA reductase-like NAD-dependent aldehyde dehydrogenase [Povalibacter uvarum]|uniref:Acyl-CoA reductase-like NAD-dependent aldehyde dehydrogenase n=1 Tax=Povalibacter uvarum TaxID=732238 RepID=A0A841HML8_9GAMM|nr:aldehyde dehydrogenase family protein [Povalibacter uvarum]MBB6093428.1 acyl-CoA reductase-like NAD-dependent aldehyde dehydrogenase [Povalibacter uvarum]